MVIHYAADYFPYGKVLRSYAPCTFSSPRYQTTHHERDAATGYDNRGARLYDAEIARFLGVDPLAGEFGAWSGYNYVLGNPVGLVDPDGRAPKDIIITGTKAEKQNILESLQVLTNDALGIKASGEVFVIKKGAKHEGVSLNAGTKLIGDLISDNNTTSIEAFDGNGNGTNPGLGELTKENVARLLSGKEVDARVFYDRTSQGEKILNADGTTGRKPVIGLAHELIHALRYVTGKHLGPGKSNLVDPDKAAEGKVLGVEEAAVRELEKAIREEQGEKARAEAKEKE